MSDLGEIYKAMNDRSREKKESNKRSSTDELKRHNIEFEEKNDGYHIVVSHNGFKVDFWPSTGKFIFRWKKSGGRGVFNLLRKLGVKK